MNPTKNGVNFCGVGMGIDQAKIDLPISNHVEVDHSWSLPNIQECCPNAETSTSLNNLKNHYR